MVLEDNMSCKSQIRKGVRYENEEEYRFICMIHRHPFTLVIVEGGYGTRNSNASEMDSIV